MYTIYFGNKEVRLPNYSFDIAEMLETVGAINNSNRAYKEKCSEVYEFEKKLLGESTVNELVGEFNSCDPNDIQLLFMGIVDCYNQPIKQKRDEQLKNALNRTDFSKISKLMEIADKLNK